MVPGVGHEGGGIEHQRIIARIPIHALLRGNRQHRRRKGDFPGHGKRAVIAAENQLNPVPADAAADQEQDGTEHQRSSAFHALVAVGMLVVGSLAGKPDAQPGNHGCADVRKRMHGIRNHCARMPKNPGEQLRRREEHIAQDGRRRHAANHPPLFLRGKMFDTCRKITSSHGKRMLLWHLTDPNKKHL